MDLVRLTISELQKGFRAGTFHPVDVLRALELRIQEVEPSVQAFLSRDFEAALRRAEAANVPCLSAEFPLASKMLSTCRATRAAALRGILEGYTALYDATAIARLRAAGAIPFGRLDLDEFAAMGSSTENSAFQTTRNPWDTSRIPGGSSGGSAAAVAACEVPPPWDRIPAARSANRLRFADALALSRVTGAYRVRAGCLCFLAGSNRPSGAFDTRLRAVAQCNRRA